MADTPPVVVWLRWDDASYQRECNADELVPRIELVSAGLLVQETEDTVSLALDWCPVDRTWRHIQHVPKVLIRQRGTYGG